MTRFTLFIFTVLFLLSCKNKKAVEKSITVSAKREVVTHTDTLQFISFDGNAVLAGADQVGIAERPSGEKKYYLVETGTHGEDNYSELRKLNN